MQFALGGLLRQPDRAFVTDDPALASYLATVERSGRVQVLTHVIRAWREFDIARACPLTTAALRARGCWDETLISLVAEPLSSAFRERLRDDVLACLAGHEDPLVASVAQFERAYLAVSQGSDECFVVSWDREPLAALGAILSGSPVGDDRQVAPHTMRVSRKHPNNFDITPNASASLESSN